MKKSSYSGRLSQTRGNREKTKHTDKLTERFWVTQKKVILNIQLDTIKRT